MRSSYKALSAAAILASTLLLSSCSLLPSSSNDQPSIPPAPPASVAAPTSVALPTTQAPAALPSIAQDKTAAIGSFKSLLEQTYNISAANAKQLPIINARYGSIPDAAYLQEIVPLLPALSVFENPSFGTSGSAKVINSFLTGYLSSNNGEALQFPSKVSISADISKVVLSPDQTTATFPLNALSLHYQGKTLAFPVATKATAEKVNGKWYLSSSGL